jgi:O-antigen ligase/polysaccharide polymerase Wzy-like membrane protein
MIAEALSQKTQAFTHWVIAAVLACSVGVLAHSNTAVAVVLTFSIAVLALGLQRSSICLAWVLVGGLLILNYGFNNISLPIGSSRIPFPEAVLPILLLAVGGRRWRTLRKDWIGPLIVANLLMAAFRLLIDVPRYHELAIRDSLYLIDALFILVGAAVVERLGAARSLQILKLILILALGYYSLLPLKQTLIAWSPLVGVQRPVPLLGAFSNLAVIAAAPLAFLFGARRTTAIFVTVWTLGLLAIHQQRGIYLAFPLALAVIGTVLSRTKQRKLRRRLWIVPIAGLIGAVILTLAPSIPGRVGPTNLSFLESHLATVSGEAGPASGSVHLRLLWWGQVWNRTLDAPGGAVIGTGYGPGLIDFANNDGVDVRKPHNDFLEMFARTGFLGLGLWLALMSALVRSLVIALRRAIRVKDSSSTHIVLFALAFVTMSLAVAMTQPLLGFAYGSATLYFVAGMALGLRHHGTINQKTLS